MKQSFITRFVKSIFLKNQISKMSNCTKNIFSNEVKFQNIYLVTRDNVKIGCWVLEPRNEHVENRKYILLLHGTSTNRMTFSKSFEIERIVKMNYTILIPDYRDFGDSQGEFIIESVNYDIDACLEYMYKRFESFVHIIGYSLGAAIALEYIKHLKTISSNDDVSIKNKSLTHHEHLGKIVLIAPFYSTLKILEDFLIWRIFSFIFSFAVKKIVKEFNHNSIDNIKYLDKDEILICHGKRDGLVNFSHSLGLQDAIGCELFHGEFDNHFTVLFNNECWEKITEFLKNF